MRARTFSATGGIRYGLYAIKSIGRSVVDAIIAERNRAIFAYPAEFY